MNKDDITGLVEMLASWSDSEFAAAASGEFCEDLKARIEGALGIQADALANLSARVETLEAEALEWKAQHENLLSVRQQDLSAMQAKIDGLQKEITFKNEAMQLTKGCPGKVVVRNGFYKIDCYKKKHARQALAGDDHG